MNGAVNEDKHPDWWTHISDSGPHAQHCAGVMVGLQRLTSLALCQDYQGIEDFIELADIEDPAPESKPFVPKPADICRIRVALSTEVDRNILHFPDVDRRVVRGGVSQASRTM